jgi:ADP-ribose pyrophosphatase YjhB (NUDIX family)
MTTVTDSLLYELVTGSHAEGTTCLAVAAAIEHHDCTLLVAPAHDDFGPVWQLPSDLVLPGETLIVGLYRTVSVTTGLDVIDVTGYLGHHDRLINGEVVRTFVFTVTADDPDRLCRWANISHRWTADPVTACDAFSEDLLGGTPFLAAGLLSATPMGQLSAALRASAKGLLCTEAAIELLLEQPWLHRRDFVDNFVSGSGGTGPHHGQGPTRSFDAVFVDWAGALAALDSGRLPCSSAEGQVLRIAAGLAEGIPVDLRHVLIGLDATNIRLVSQTIYHAAGHRR